VGQKTSHWSSWMRGGTTLTWPDPRNRGRSFYHISEADLLIVQECGQPNSKWLGAAPALASPSSSLLKKLRHAESVFVVRRKFRDQERETFGDIDANEAGSSTSVTRSVSVKMTSTMLRAPLSRERRTSTADNAALRA